MAKAVIRRLTEELQRLERAIIPPSIRKLIIRDLSGRYRFPDGKTAHAPGPDDILITIVSPQRLAA